MFQQCMMGFDATKKEFQVTCDEYYDDFVNVMLQVLDNIIQFRSIFIGFETPDRQTIPDLLNLINTNPSSINNLLKYPISPKSSFVTILPQPVLMPGLRQFDTLNFNIDQATYADYQVFFVSLPPHHLNNH